MSHVLIADIFRRFHRRAEVCVRELSEELFRRHGESFVLVPVGVEGVLMECGADPFPVILTRVTGGACDLSFTGYPDFLEEDMRDWNPGDVYAAEDRLSLLAALLDGERWRRV